MKKTIVIELEEISYGLETEFRFWIEDDSLRIDIAAEEAQFDEYSIKLTALRDLLDQLGALQKMQSFTD